MLRRWCRRYYTASLAAFTGRALMIFRAGFALNTVGSFGNGLMPFRAIVAGFLMTTNLANPVYAFDLIKLDCGFLRLRTGIPIDCGQSFQSIADSIPMIADSSPTDGF